MVFETKLLSTANPRFPQGEVLQLQSILVPPQANATRDHSHHSRATHIPRYRDLFPPLLQQQKEAEMKAGLSKFQERLKMVSWNKESTRKQEHLCCIALGRSIIPSAVKLPFA